MNSPFWIKPAITLSALGLLTWLAPVEPLDPWNLVSLKKIAAMILALAMIQALGSVMMRFLGTRNGAVLTGFFGGIVSSTATTASLAKNSKNSGKSHISGEVLIFLSATGAMLFEGLALLITGTSKLHFSTLVIFIGPILATVALAFMQYRERPKQNEQTQSSDFLILPILKLSVFIIGILTVSKVFQNFLGENSLLVVTGLVSLFEIHGSVIANIQMHEAGTVSIRLLCSLLAISVIASYLSKLFLIWTLGSRLLRTHAIKSTALLFVSLAVSWAISMALV